MNWSFSISVAKLVTTRGWQLNRFQPFRDNLNVPQLVSWEVGNNQGTLWNNPVPCKQAWPAGKSPTWVWWYFPIQRPIDLYDFPFKPPLREMFHDFPSILIHEFSNNSKEISNMLWGFATNSFFHEARRMTGSWLGNFWVQKRTSRKARVHSKKKTHLYRRTST